MQELQPKLLQMQEMLGGILVPSRAYGDSGALFWTQKRLVIHRKSVIQGHDLLMGIHWGASHRACTMHGLGRECRSYPSLHKVCMVCMM